MLAVPQALATVNTTVVVSAETPVIAPVELTADATLGLMVVQEVVPPVEVAVNITVEPTQIGDVPEMAPAVGIGVTVTE